MRGIVADVNIEGHVDRLVAFIRTSEWADYWNHLELVHATLAELGLRDTAPDVDVWRSCQREALVLITANRNNDGPDSLEATIRAENTLDSLPVLTLGDAEEVLHNREYAERVVESLMEYLYDIDRYRGAGRLYLP